jgi:hypothetical protein
MGGCVHTGRIVPLYAFATSGGPSAARVLVQDRSPIAIAERQSEWCDTTVDRRRGGAVQLSTQNREMTAERLDAFSRTWLRADVGALGEYLAEDVV